MKITAVSIVSVINAMELSFCTDKLGFNNVQSQNSVFLILPFQN